MVHRKSVSQHRGEIPACWIDGQVIARLSRQYVTSLGAAFLEHDHSGRGDSTCSWVPWYTGSFYSEFQPLNSPINGHTPEALIRFMHHVLVTFGELKISIEGKR